jgi:hypothetical protein
VVLEKISRLTKANPQAATLYLVIPADLVKDSEFPFANGDNITIKIDPAHQRLVIEAIRQ